MRRAVDLLAIALITMLSSLSSATPRDVTSADEHSGLVIHPTPPMARYDFRFAIEAEPGSVDPAAATGINEGQVVDNLFEGLVEYPVGEGSVVPGVAERWEIAGDGLVYTFHLRLGARWSDGRAVTAHDFQRSWLRLLDPKRRRAQRELLYSVQGAEAYGLGRNPDPKSVGIEVVSTHVLRVILSHPAPYFLELCAFSALRPIAEGQNDVAFTPAGVKQLVTNGPFKLEAWRPGERLVLVRNHRYWARDRVRMAWISVEPVRDNAEVVRRYLAHRLDWTGTVDLPLASIKALSQRADYREDPSYGTYYLRVNAAHPDLGDNRIRRALNLAVDRDGIVELVAGGVRAATSFVPPTQGYSSGVGRVEWRPKAARSLLAQARSGARLKSLTLLINDQPNHRAIAARLVADWKRVLGITVTIEALPWPDYLARLAKGDYQIARAGWLGDYQDPMSFLELWGRDHTHNTSGWFDREYTGLLEKARRARLADERGRLLTSAESILLKRGPVIPLFFYARTSLLNPRVRGFASNRLGHHLLKYIAVD